MSPEMTAIILSALTASGVALTAVAKVLYARATKKQDALEDKVDTSQRKTEEDLKNCLEHHAICEKHNQDLAGEVLTVSKRVERLEGRSEGWDAHKSKGETDTPAA